VLFVSLSVDNGTTGNSPIPGEWHELPLLLHRACDDGVEFGRVMFVPVGEFEATAFVSGVTTGAERHWLGSYGDNLVMRSSWDEVVPRDPSGHFRSFRPLGLNAFASSSDLKCLSATPSPSGGDATRRKCLSTSVPWFAGKYDEFQTCSVMESLCNQDQTWTEQQGPEHLCSLSPTTLASVYTTCVLIHHLDGSSPRLSSAATIRRQLQLIKQAIQRSPHPSVVSRIVSLCTGYSGNKVSDIVSAFSCPLSSICSGKPSKHPTHVSTAPELTPSAGCDVGAACLSHHCDSVNTVVKWAFHTVPSLAERHGSAVGPLTHLSLELADVVVESHAGHPAASRIVHCLVQHLLVPASAVR
jgi:hypothetical protein